MTSRNTLRWRLRDATAHAHARLDARLGPAFDDAEGYAAFLRGMHRFGMAACAATADDRMLIDSTRMLRADLQDLGLAPLPAAPVRACTPDEALGWRYVAAGASLGARLLLPRAHALGFGAHHGARYLAYQAGGPHWRLFLESLDGVPGTAADDACRGALEAFAVAEAGMREAFEAMPA